MTDDSRRVAPRPHQARRRPRRTARQASRPAEPPRWVTTFVIPRDACPPCAQHLHHRCHGVDVLRDPIPECPCDCGDARNPLFLNARAWADLALHAPDQVWIAALFERQRAAGLFTCTWRKDDSGLTAARLE
ncbi:hypothetical protein [Streptomyces ipomoeae]|uniref:hypothetical protein n=1 Tax=Streptomyces ipomoeae TaxID=103232 RepID=UPI0011464AF6|nr:hypothetical protein [Streptomyces ipomoeae]TQE33107.1 hypothetical protein Sipo7851_21655 [Streptomyces ipomoeae]